MNKVILGLILAVCGLGMALVMLNERLGRNPEPTSPPAIADVRQNMPEPVAPVADASPAPALNLPRLADNTRELELENAREALAPPHEAALPEPEKLAPVEPAAPVMPQARPEAPRPVVEAPKPTPKVEQTEAPRAKPKVEQVEPPKPVVEKPAEAKPKAGKGKNITRFVIFAREKGATIRISGNQALGHKIMTLESPDRVVIDLDGEWNLPTNPGIPKNDLVNNVRLGKLGDNSRIVIDLKGKPRTSRVVPTKNGDSVDIRVDK